jgi:PPOX class probable F420-dependent enzyme
VDDDVMRARVAGAPVGRLATVDPGGHPHLVPCCFVLAGDTIYSAVDGKPKSTTALRRLDNLRANPHAALLVDHYADDWSTLWWVRVDGEGRILDPGPEQDDALARLLAKYDQYRTVPLPGPVLAIDTTAWRGWP